VHCLIIPVGMQSKQQDFGGMVERSLETSREVTGSSNCKEGQVQTRSGGGDAI